MREEEKKEPPAFLRSKHKVYVEARQDLDRNISNEMKVWVVWGHVIPLKGLVAILAGTLMLLSISVDFSYGEMIKKAHSQSTKYFLAVCV